MFKKNSCYNCGRKTSKDYSYCPFCGINLKDTPEQNMDFSEFKLPFPFNKMLNKFLNPEVINQLARELDKALEVDENGNIKPHAIKIKIGTGNPTSNSEDNSKSTRNIRKISESDAKRYAQLKREEPKTIVKRLANRIIYVLSIPGVTKLKDVFITKLANSVEIKAFGKEKAYFKLVPYAFNIKKYALNEDMLTIEFSE